MSTWRYVSTHLITGQVLADNLPLQVQSFTSQLNGGGTLSGSLDLSIGAQQGLVTYGPQGQPFVAALECERTVLWVLADNYPVWCGIVWDWPDMTRSQGTLSISATTLDSLWGSRLITDTIEYQAVDLFAAFLDLVTYGMTKQSPYISSVSPPATRPQAYLDLFASNGGVANLVLPTGAAAKAGQTWTAGYTYSDETQISSAWSDMVTAGNFEYAFTPGLDESGNLAIFVQMAYTQLGRPVAESGYSLNYGPGGNVLDYGYQRTGSQGANGIIGTAPPNGSAEQWQSAFPHGYDLPTIGEGYPILESTVSWNGSVVTSQAQINAFADGQLPLYSQAMTTPVINVGGDGAPPLRDVVIGDGVPFSATSNLHPARSPGLEPGLQTEVRVTAVTVYPDGPSQSYYYQLTTSVVSSS